MSVTDHNKDHVRGLSPRDFDAGERHANGEAIILSLQQKGDHRFPNRRQTIGNVARLENREAQISFPTL